MRRTFRTWSESNISHVRRIDARLIGTFKPAEDRYLGPGSGLCGITQEINQERSNNKLYVSFLESSPTAYYEDKTLPNLPPSVLNVLQAGRASNRSLITSPESASEQMAVPFDYVITGSYSLKITVK